MPTNKILPTHSCFDDAMDYLAERCKADPATARGLILVHAICLFPVRQKNAGRRFAHAWVEEGDLCWAAGLLATGERVIYSATRDEYYADLRPVNVTRYTLHQVYEENQRTRCNGPWKPEYLSLCKDTKNAETKPPAHPQRVRRRLCRADHPGDERVRAQSR